MKVKFLLFGFILSLFLVPSTFANADDNGVKLLLPNDLSWHLYMDLPDFGNPELSISKEGDENYDIRSEALEAIDVTTKLIDYRFGGANWDVVEEYFDTEVFKGVSNENTTVDSAGKLFEKEDDDDED